MTRGSGPCAARSRALGCVCVALAVMACAPEPRDEPWPGLRDASRELHTERYSFGGSNPLAGTDNENYYDGDMGDIDGDRRPDRILGSRYGLLHNQGGGEMVVARQAFGFLLRGDPGARGFGDDAMQLADIDGDGDLDAITGGNNEPLVAQINHGGRFRIGWIERDDSHSALNIVNTDVERDGDVDLVTAHSFCATRPCGGPVTFNLYVNDGRGVFEEVSAQRGLAYGDSAYVVGIASGDVDRDGDFDLVIAHGALDRIEIALNDGRGHYTIVPTHIPTSCGGFPQALNLGDIDDDGDLDIAYGRCGLAYPGGHPRMLSVLALNDGHGVFRDVSSSHWDLSGYPGERAQIESQQAKLVDLDHDGDLDFLGLQKQSRDASMHLIFMRNRGDGHMAYDPAHSMDVAGPDTGLGADMDITDLDGDGSYDAWLGVSGGDVRILLNLHREADGLPADMPRALEVLEAARGGITLRFEPPPFAATARRYRVYRSHASGLDEADRSVVADIALSVHEDEGFSAPVTRHTTAAELGMADVGIDPETGAIRFTDRSAIPGVEYHYAVAHVGTENTRSAQTAEVRARIPAEGTDHAAPGLALVSPTEQTETRWPRIALHFGGVGNGGVGNTGVGNAAQGEGVGGIDPASLHVSFDVPVGGLPAHANLVDFDDAHDFDEHVIRHDDHAFIASLAPPYTLPRDTLVTLTAKVEDRSGKQRVEHVRFFVGAEPARTGIGLETSDEAPTTGGVGPD